MTLPTPPLAAAEPATADFIVVSNRLPPRESVGRRQNVGGLVSGLRPAMAAREGLWLGWDAGRPEGEDTDEEIAPGQSLPGPSQSGERASWTRAALHLPPEIAEPYYSGFCNGVLWPLLHSMTARVEYDDAAWSAYQAANDRFAAAVMRFASRDATVWVHDYHLMLMASSLRQRGFTGRLGFFLHVPFPPLEVIEGLPRCERILEGLAAFDLVGFHTQRYVKNFVAAAQEITGCRVVPGGIEQRDHTCRVEAFPIGIDPGMFAPRDEDGDADDDLAQLDRSLGERKLLLGVDRLDYTKGICERLIGYERLLREHPEWRGKVVLVQVAVPSREEVPEYQALRSKVESLVGRINGEHGEADWVPVRYLYRSYGPPELSRLYRMADVALVTPIRDGMNLVAKEFVAAQDAADPGVLVLSRFAGAAVELDAAVLTNPMHADGLARDIDKALRMKLAERRRRHLRCLDRVTTNTATAWGEKFLGALDAVDPEPITRPRALAMAK